MSTVTVSLTHLMIAVPILAGIYFLFCKRAWLWRCKRTLFRCGVTIASVLSVVGLVVINNPIKARSIAQPIIDQNLPNEWEELYRSIKRCSFWEAKISAIEAFSKYFEPEDVPPLSPKGFNLLLTTLDTKTSTKYSWELIDRAKKALESYLVPFKMNEEIKSADSEVTANKNKQASANEQKASPDAPPMG